MQLTLADIVTSLRRPRSGSALSAFLARLARYWQSSVELYGLLSPTLVKSERERQKLTLTVKVGPAGAGK
jgi:hypothetical protein